MITRKLFLSIATFLLLVFLVSLVYAAGDFGKDAQGRSFPVVGVVAMVLLIGVRIMWRIHPLLGIIAFIGGAFVMGLWVL